MTDDEQLILAQGKMRMAVLDALDEYADAVKQPRWTDRKLKKLFKALDEVVPIPEQNDTLSAKDMYELRNRYAETLVDRCSINELKEIAFDDIYAATIDMSDADFLVLAKGVI